MTGMHPRCLNRTLKSRSILGFFLVIFASTLCHGVGRSGAIARPPNPWGEEWEHIRDGLDQTRVLHVNAKEAGQEDADVPLLRNVLIINCNVHDVSGHYAIGVFKCENVLIMNNTVNNHTVQEHSAGIHANKYCKNVHIVNNTITNCNGNGISSGGGSKYPTQGPNPGMEIRNNFIHNVAMLYRPPGEPWAMHGMYIKARDVLVEGNIVSNVHDASGLSIRSTGIYRNNIVYNSGGIGYWKQMEAGPSETLIIENNLVYQEPDWINKHNKPIKNNYLSTLLFCDGNSKANRPVQHFDNVFIRFNTLVAFEGCHLNGNAVVLNATRGDFGNMRFYGNIIVDMRTHVHKEIIREEEGCSYFDKNYVSRSDEGFADLAGRDFHLTKKHPAVDFAIGVKHGFPPADRDGVTRYASSLDVGAYAYPADEPAAFLNVDTTSLTFGFFSDRSDMEVRSNARWSVSADRTWIGVSPASDSGNGTIRVSVTKNNSDKARTGTVTVSGDGIRQKIAISQESGATPLHEFASSILRTRAINRTAVFYTSRGRRFARAGNGINREGNGIVIMRTRQGAIKRIPAIKNASTR